MQAKNEQSDFDQKKRDDDKNRRKEKRDLEIAVWNQSLARLLPPPQVSVEDYDKMQKINRNYPLLVANAVNVSMQHLANKYLLVTEEQREEIKRDIMIALEDAEDSEDTRFVVFADYKVTYRNFFFCAKKSEAAAATTAIGFKIHLSADEESGQNLAKAWVSTLRVTRKYDIPSFKMVSDLTVDDKKGRQVTIYLHPTAEQMPELVKQVPALVQDLACTLAYEQVKPDKRGMPEDCCTVPGARYVSFRYDAFQFSYGPGYLSQDHLDCAKRVIDNLDQTSDSKEKIIQDYMSEINERYGEGLDDGFKAEIMEILDEADKQFKQTGEVKWYSLQLREEDVALGNALEACTVQPAELMRADNHGLRHYGERVDVTVVHEPLDREAIEREETAEAECLKAVWTGLKQ